MKVLELFAGKRSIGKAFEERWHDVFSVEMDTQHENIDWYADIMTITAQDILDRFGRPDVIWASPPCTSYSILGLRWHRKKNVETGLYDPISDYARFSDTLIPHVLKLIEELKPKYWFIENPRGTLCRMPFMQGLPLYKVTYCQYGAHSMKPTHIWTNHPHPNFRPTCKNGDSCHERAPRAHTAKKLGIKVGGIQGMKNAVERSIIPYQLCHHISLISEEDYNGKNDERTTLLPQVEA